MLTENQLYATESQAIDDYIEFIQSNRYSNEVINGDIQKWTDADDYYTVPGSCTISGDTIKDWLIDRFDSLIEAIILDFCDILKNFKIFTPLNFSLKRGN